VTSKGFGGIALAARGMTAGVGAAALAGGYLTKQFVESNKVAQQTNAVLKSTGGAAGVTAKQVSDLATSISRKTGMDDEAIQSGENLLLTFTNIHNETGRGNQIFTRATRTIADMSAALGQDTKSSAIQLGKALNDPIKGVTALQRVGVSFTQSQRDQIKTLVESGHTLDAQKIILRELRKEFGGSAAAIATPFDKLKVSAGNLAETAGGFLAPALGKAANATNRFLNQMQDGTGTGGKFVRAMQNAAAALKDAWQTSVAAVRRFIARNRDDIDSVIQAMKNLAKAAQYWFREVIVPVVRVEIRALGRILNNVVEIFRGVIRIVSGVLTGDWRKAWQGVKDVVGGTVRGIGNILRGAVEVMGRSRRGSGSRSSRGSSWACAGWVARSRRRLAGTSRTRSVTSRSSGRR
jgi:phage-related minor tail protein